MNAKFQVLAELAIELLKVLLIFSEFLEEFQALLDKVLADNFKNLVLLEHLTGNVQRKILRIDNALHEVEIIGNDFLAVVHDKDTTDIKLHVVLLLFSFEEIERNSAWHEKQCAELELTLNTEVLNGQMIFPVVGQALVEFAIFFLGNIIGVACPNWLGLVQFLILCVLNLDSLLFLAILLVSILIIANIFNLGLISFTY
jgi:hypothetical protein